jgi:hypothetical protein
MLLNALTIVRALKNDATKKELKGPHVEAGGAAQP